MCPRVRCECIPVAVSTGNASCLGLTLPLKRVTFSYQASDHEQGAKGKSNEFGFQFSVVHAVEWSPPQTLNPKPLNPLETVTWVNVKIMVIPRAFLV